METQFVTLSCSIILIPIELFFKTFLHELFTKSNVLFSLLKCDAPNHNKFFVSIKSKIFADSVLLRCPYLPDILSFKLFGYLDFARSYRHDYSLKLGHLHF